MYQSLLIKIINIYMKKENEEAVNKAVKMVLLNSFFGLIFKLPITNITAHH